MQTKITKLSIKKIISHFAILALILQSISPALAVDTNWLSSPWTMAKAEHLARKALFWANPDIINSLYNAGSAQNAVEILFPSKDWPDRTNYNNEINTFTSQTGFSVTNWTWMNKYYAFKKYRDPYEAKAKAFVMYEDIFSVNAETWNWINYSDIENTHKIIYDNMFNSDYKSLIKKIVFNGQMWWWDYSLGQFLTFFNQQYPNSPNENYARELMQLFLMLEYKPWENQDTLWAVKNYTDADIASFARILTWLESDANTHQVSFNPNKHNTWSFLFLTWALKSWDSFPFYNEASWTINSQTITNSINWNNWLTDNAVDYIFSKRYNEIADFLAWRLLKYYVKDKPTKAEIETLASVIVANNFDMYASTKYLLASDVMYSDSSMNTIYYKNPLELTIWTLKLLHYKNPSIIDPFIYDSSLLTNFEWTPYFPGSIFWRDWFDLNFKFFNAYNHNQWVNFSTKLAYYSNSTYYNLDDLLPVKRLSETWSLDIKTSTWNTFSGTMNLENISLTISWTLNSVTSIQSVENISSQEITTDSTWEIKTETPVIFPESESIIPVTSEEKSSEETPVSIIMDFFKLNTANATDETTSTETETTTTTTSETIPETTSTIVSTENIVTENTNLQTNENTWGVVENLEKTSSPTIEIQSENSNTETPVTIQAENNIINFTQANVSLPNFSITAMDNSPVTISSGTINMSTKKLMIYAWKVTYMGNTYDISSGTADISTLSNLERDISILEMISQLENYLYLWRKLPTSVKTEIEKYLLTDESGKSRLFLPNNTDYKNKYIRWVISMMLVQPEFVMISWFDKTTNNDNSWTSLLPNSNSKLVFVELYGWYDWLHALVQKDNYDDYVTKRQSLALARENLIDLGDYYMNPAYQAYKPIYDSNNLRIVNRVGSTKHSRWHDTAAIQITSKYWKESIWTPSIIGNLIEAEADATKNIVLWTNSPNIYSNWNYLNMWGWDSRYTNYAWNLTSSGKISQLQAIRNSLNSREYPADSARLFKASSIIDNVANISKNAGGQPSSGYSLKQRLDFTKVLIDNNLWTTYYVPGGGWYDTHWDQVTTWTWDYDLSNRTKDLSTEIANFWNNTKNKDVTIVVFSEFGRTLKTNGTTWTDHGQWWWMFILSSNNNLLNSIPNKVVWTQNLSKEKEDWFGVWVDYRAIYNKILWNLYNISDSYLWTEFNLENNLSLESPSINNFNIEQKSNSSNVNNTISFDIDSKNFDINNASNVSVKYWKDFNNLTNKINNWEMQYSSNPIVKWKQVKFTKWITWTWFAYEIKITNDQFAETTLTWTIENTVNTGWLFINPNKDTVIRNYVKNISWELSLSWAQRILIWATSSWETLKSFTKWNWITLKIGSWTTYIEKLTGSWIWNWGFKLWEFMNPNLVFSSWSQTASWEKMKNLQVEKIVKIWADTLWIWLKLDRNVDLEVSSLKSNTKYKVLYSEDAKTWNYMSWITTDSTWKANVSTNHFTYFAFTEDVPDDLTPDNFVFNPVSNSELNTSYTSNSVTISWINKSIPISIVWWEYSKNAQTFTSNSWTINNWDTIVLKWTSSSSNSTLTQITVNIWWIISNFNITTKALIPVSTWWSSSWWGGGGSVSRDYCPSGDYSKSYYDRTCWTKVNVSTWTISNISTWIIQKPVIVNPVINTWYEKKYINYKWIKVLDIKNYSYSQVIRKQAFIILMSKNYSTDRKKWYIDRLNSLLEAKFNLDTDKLMDVNSLNMRYIKRKILLDSYTKRKM